MNAQQTLELISKQWCDLDDLMSLAQIGKNNALTLRRNIKKELENNGYKLPKNLLPMCEVINYLKINVEYLEKRCKKGE